MKLVEKEVESVALMRCGTTDSGCETEEQETQLLLKEPEKYPTGIQVVLESATVLDAALYSDYDPAYTCSTERMSPLWHIT